MAFYSPIIFFLSNKMTIVLDISIEFRAGCRSYEAKSNVKVIHAWFFF